MRKGEVYHKHLLVHRVSYEWARGAIPEGVLVLHSCDNRLCVNPQHLRLGTHQDNMDDMVRAGRQRSERGAAHAQAKLTPEAVSEIRDRYAEGGVTQKVLAEEYGISSTHIGRILRLERWV